MSYSISTGKDDFYRQIFKLAIPIIIQNLLSAAVNSADVIMLNYVRQSSISAVSLAAKLLLQQILIWQAGSTSLQTASSIRQQKLNGQT